MIERERENAWAGFLLAAQRKNKDWRTHDDLGNVLDEIGDSEQAIKEFKSALQSAPDDPSCITTLE